MSIEGIIWLTFFALFKGVILTDALTAMARTWGIFNPIRNQVKCISFFRRLLDCYECTSVWAAGFVILYFNYFEIQWLTWLLILHRLAFYVSKIYELLDASRAVKEKQL